MKMRRWMSCLSFLAIAMSTAGTTVAQPPTAKPEADPHDTLVVWLDGPFGRVAGGGPDAPAGAPPYGEPLDTLVRDVPLSMEADVPFDDLIAIEVYARSVSGVGNEETLSDGTTMFDGPSNPGTAVIVATLQTEPFGLTQHAWLVSVPDREYTQEALFEISAPAVELISDAGIVSGAPGDGCYVYFCADMGDSPPPRSLDVLRVGVGETLALRTSDGSGLAGWNGRLTPLRGTTIDSIDATGALTDTVESTLTLGGLEAPARGQWRLQVRVVFDRERGHQWQSFRLDAR